MLRLEPETVSTNKPVSALADQWCVAQIRDDFGYVAVHMDALEQLRRLLGVL